MKVNTYVTNSGCLTPPAHQGSSSGGLIPEGCKSHRDSVHKLSLMAPSRMAGTPYPAPLPADASRTLLALSASLAEPGQKDTCLNGGCPPPTGVGLGTFCKLLKLLFPHLHKEDESKQGTAHFL